MNSGRGRRRRRAVPVWRVAVAMSATLVGGAVVLERAQGSAAGVTSAVSASASTPTASTPADPPRAVVRASSASRVAAAPAALQPRRTTSLLVFGDSVPSGAACGCGGFGTTLAATTPARLTNVAKGGLTSAGLLAQLRQPAIVRAIRQAGVVTVTIGANDLNESSASDPACANLSCYAYTLRHTAANIRTAAAVIDEWTGPDTTVVFTGYWNVFLDGAVGAEQGSTYVRTSTALTRRFNALVAQAAAGHHFVYADLFTPFKGNGTRDDTRLLASDGDHPNAAGHRLIASTITTTAHL